MKIDAVGAEYSAPVRRVNGSAGALGRSDSPLPKTSIISFRSGNPRHIAHVVAEEPLFGLKGGGVGTVSNDYNYLHKDGIDKIVKIIPLYNQQVDYKEGQGKNGRISDPVAQDVKVRLIPNNLPEGHPFKGKEGMPFITGKEINNSTDIAEFLKKESENVFLLEEIKSSKINWGMEENIPVRMYRALKEGALIEQMKKNHIDEALQNKLEFVFTYVDSTSSMPKPYSDGMSYATVSGTELEKRLASGWRGQGYAKFNKAAVKLLPGLKEKLGVDPKYILCSDGQTMFTMHYAAQKNAAGDSYWQDKFLGGVGHNMNRGYIQEMGARQAIVNLGATKKEIETLVNSKEYIEALREGREEEFLKKNVLKNFCKSSGEMSAFSIPIHYASAGYVPMLTTVSEGYHDAIIENKLISPLYEDLKKLNELGRFKGILNPLTDPKVNPFSSDILQAGYKNAVKLKLKDGTEHEIKPFQVFDKNKSDLKSVREVKRQNKINLLERFNEKFAGSCYYDKKNEKWGKPDTGRMAVVTGDPGRKANIYGKFSDEYITKLKNGKDVKLVVSWGRGDFQKGMDTVIDSFEKFVEKHPNDDTILLFGGDMKNEKQTVEKFKSALAKSNLKGRMVLVDGFAPGKDFAMAADAALLPSRFAPCELTDLEAKKCLCTPIVPNVQGMAQKNFDPLGEKAELMDAYKGRHEYFMTEEEALKAANEDAKSAFETVKNKLAKNIREKYKGQLNKDIPDTLFKQKLEAEPEYTEALKTLRDSVISDEMAECLDRALVKDRNGKNAETVLQNQISRSTKWFENGALSQTGKSSGDLYFEYHFNNKGKNISKKDLITLDFSGIAGSRGSKFGYNIKQFLHSHKKTAVVTGGILGLGGLAWLGYAKGWFSPKFAEDNGTEHISRIG